LPITVSFEIENTGNKTFSGKVTLEVTHEKGSYPLQVLITANLSKGEVYRNSTSYATDYEGRYWTRVKIEADDLSPIDLYVGQTLVTNGSRVSYDGASAYLYSLPISVTIIGVALSAIGGTIAWQARRKKGPSLSVDEIMCEHNPSKGNRNTVIRIEFRVHNTGDKSTQLTRLEIPELQKSCTLERVVDVDTSPKMECVFLAPGRVIVRKKLELVFLLHHTHGEEEFKTTSIKTSRNLSDVTFL
jgi:hypothetical protein